MFYELQEILTTFIFWFISNFLLNYILIFTKSKHIKFTGDHSLGPQKVHKGAPRVGGTIVISVCLQAILLYYVDNKVNYI